MWTSYEHCTGFTPTVGLSEWFPNWWIKWLFLLPAVSCWVIQNRMTWGGEKCVLTERKSERSLCTPAHYLSLIPAPHFTAGMWRWDQSLSVFNEHGMATVLKTTHPRNRGLGCTNRYGTVRTKSARFLGYPTVKQSWLSASRESYKLFCPVVFPVFRMSAVTVTLAQKTYKNFVSCFNLHYILVSL